MTLQPFSSGAATGGADKVAAPKPSYTSIKWPTNVDRGEASGMHKIAACGLCEVFVIGGRSSKLGLRSVWR